MRADSDLLRSFRDTIMKTEQATFVINLESRNDRRVEMKKQLLSIGWRAEFFSAIQPRDAGNFPSLGARGCFLSHLEVLKKAKKDRVQQLAILEDDVSFVRGFTSKWMAALDNKEWSIFYPGHILKELPVGLSALSPSTAVRCAHFMLVDGIAISQLIVGLETIMSRPSGHPLGGPMHVDGAYSTIRMQNLLLKTYAYYPTLGYQRPSRTDVGDLAWFDRVIQLRPLLNFARKLKRMF
jgi:glycosyl transferase family 25